jgi:diacylglycerol kinase family enzyme
VKPATRSARPNRRATALDRVTAGIVPCGTGNDFAGNVGITGIEQAFEVLDRGERRRVDFGVDDDRPFRNSCICGLTAEASAETDPEQKDRFGTVAYVLNTLRTISEFDSVRVTVALYDDETDATVWAGSALAALVGNGRRFPPGGSEQADVEDGRFDVVVVHDTDSVGLVGTTLAEHVLERDTDRTSRYTVSSLDIDLKGHEPVAFSLDGEILQRRHLSLETRSRALRLAVGPGYEPNPVGGAWDACTHSTSTPTRGSSTGRRGRRRGTTRSAHACTRQSPPGVTSTASR